MSQTAYRPGYKTSEFWFTLVSFVISGLFLAGVITEPGTKDNMISVGTHVVESIILLGGQFIVLSKYLKKRKEERLEHERTIQKEQDNLKKELEDYVGVDKKIEKVSINTGSIGELIQLPHIGPATAQKIIDYRTRYGDFKTKEDIMLVSGIADTVYQDIEKYITLN